jgi:hypothetical protein
MVNMNECGKGKKDSFCVYFIQKTNREHLILIGQAQKHIKR